MAKKKKEEKVENKGSLTISWINHGDGSLSMKTTFEGVTNALEMVGMLHYVERDLLNRFDKQIS